VKDSFAFFGSFVVAVGKVILQVFFSRSTIAVGGRAFGVDTFHTVVDMGRDNVTDIVQNLCNVTMGPNQGTSNVSHHHCCSAFVEQETAGQHCRMFKVEISSVFPAGWEIL